MTDEFEKYKVAPAPPAEDEFAKYKVSPTAPAEDEFAKYKVQPSLPDDVDPILYNTFKTQGATHEDAVSRAQNVASTMRESAPETKARDLSEYEDASSILGTAIEGALDGITFGAGTSLEGVIGDLTGIPGISSADIKAREEANTATYYGANIGASLLTGGASILEQVAARGLAQAAGKGIAKRTGAAIVRNLAAADVAGKVAGKVTTKVGAKLLGSTVARETGNVVADLERIREKVRLGQTVSQAEQDILDVALRQSKRTVAAPTKKMAERAAVRERTQFVVEQKLADRYDRLGWGKRAIQLATQTGIGAGIGAATGVGQTAREELARNALEQQDVPQEAIDAVGETLGSRLLRNMGRGAVIGAEIGGGVPLTLKGISLASKAIRQILSFGAEAIPTVGSTRFSGATKGELATAKGNIDRSIGVGEIWEPAQLEGHHQNALINSLQYQHDNAEDLVRHLESFNRTDGVVAPLEPLPYTDAQVREVLGRVREDWMRQQKDGTWVFNQKRIIDAIKADPNVRSSLKLPGSLGELNDMLDGIEAVVADNTGQSATRGLFPSPLRLPPETNPFPERTSETLGFGIGKLAFGPTGLSPRTDYGAIIDTSKIPAYLADPKLQSVLEGQSFGKQFGELAGAATTVGTIAGLAGASLPAALQIGGAGGVALKLTYDTFVNPYALLKNYKTFQQGLNAVDATTNQFSNFLMGKATPSSTVENIIGSKNAPTAGVPNPLLPVEEPQYFTSGDAQALYDADRKLIDTLSGPNGIPEFDKAFSGDLDVLDATYPKLAQVAQGVIPRQVAFLARKMKELTPDPANKDVFSGLKQRQPTKAQLFQYAQYSKYTRDPDAIYTDIATKGYVPTQALEVLTEVFPARYALLQKKILAAMSEQVAAGGVVDPKQIKIINTLMNNKNGWTPESIAQMQAAMAPQTAGQGGPVGGAESKAVELQTTGTTLGK